VKVGPGEWSGRGATVQAACHALASELYHPTGMSRRRPETGANTTRYFGWPYFRALGRVSTAASGQHSSTNSRSVLVSMSRLWWWVIFVEKPAARLAIPTPLPGRRVVG
jgi:hypothetical protein